MPGRAAKAAIELIVAAPSDCSANGLGLESRDAVSEAARQIANRLLRDGNTLKQTEAFYNQTLNTFQPSWQRELHNAGKELSAILERHVPKLLSLGVLPKQIGNAAFKLRFDEIEEMASHPMFCDGSAFNVRRFGYVLTSINPRELFSRLKSTYTDPALSKLTFSRKVFLVLNPDAAETRLQEARAIVREEKGLAVLPALIAATEEQRAWFREKRAVGFISAPEKLLRISKYPAEERRKLFDFATELVAMGVTQREAMELVVSPDYESRIRKAALIASELGLTSHGIFLFASSKKGQNSPTFTATDIKTLRSLPLEWSDGTIIRMLVGDPGYKPQPHSGPFQTGDDLKAGLRATMNSGFKINRADPFEYGARRLLAQLTEEQIVAFYGVFFGSRELSTLREQIVTVRDAERNALTRCLNTARISLPDFEVDPESRGPEVFKSLCTRLSDSLISLDVPTRSAAQRLFCGWIVKYAEKYYPSYVKIDAAAVALLANVTVKNYDPKARSLREEPDTNKPSAGLYQAFGGNIKFFYRYAVNNRLAGSVEGLRALKLFTEKPGEQRRSDHKLSHAAMWEQLEAERPDLRDGIKAAQQAIAEVTTLRKQHEKQRRSASSAA
jgi:hypothetical protein